MNTNVLDGINSTIDSLIKNTRKVIEDGRKCSLESSKVLKENQQMQERIRKDLEQLIKTTDATTRRVNLMSVETKLILVYQNHDPSLKS